MLFSSSVVKEHRAEYLMNANNPYKLEQLLTQDNINFDEKVFDVKLNGVTVKASIQDVFIDSISVKKNKKVVKVKPDMFYMRYKDVDKLIDRAYKHYGLVYKPFVDETYIDHIFKLKDTDSLVVDEANLCYEKCHYDTLHAFVRMLNLVDTEGAVLTLHKEEYLRSLKKGDSIYYMPFYCERYGWYRELLKTKLVVVECSFVDCTFNAIFNENILEYYGNSVFYLDAVREGGDIGLFCALCLIYNYSKSENVRYRIRKLGESERCHVVINSPVEFDSAFIRHIGKKLSEVEKEGIGLQYYFALKTVDKRDSKEFLAYLRKAGVSGFMQLLEELQMCLHINEDNFEIQLN